MAKDFSALLDKPANEVEPPKSIPQGSYIFGIKSYKFGETKPADKSKDPTPTCEFQCIPQAPGPDVDQEELALVGLATEKGPREMRKNFFLTEDALYRLTQFLVEHCGMDGNLPTKELIQQSPGHQFMGMVVHSQSRDGQSTYANIEMTSAVPE